MLKTYHSRYHFSYRTSILHHLSALIFTLVLLSFGLLVIFNFLHPVNLSDYKNVSIYDILLATTLTLFRMIMAFVLSIIVAVPLVIISTSHPKVEKILLPVFDILQSIPPLAFFPVLVLFFIKFNLLESAAIFILFMEMVWILVFSMIGGLKTIPDDIKNVASIYKITGLNEIWYILLPAIFPQIVTGALLAWGASWSIVIVAEVLHTYIPGGTISQDLFGLGSLLVNSAFYNNNLLFLATLLVMIIIISLMNVLIWQRLLHLVQRYKFD
ncbi:hypothetical protein A2631_04110 [Candidatus Daviesbacteria bacterium RIFCSPHIGHO2_01_FULL_44_29]|uniref:ABC transmembrane type-1 domain-containing protein n=1 Tax=Candidatus Daviesbacteria bacterium RIFCSPHIGHO2_02_FULL_43_12 TaxID=1797776 RepID=A0A1F5KGE8_9BACT|nr:MAG: hypothetical protein A2631_04110 [Candidatus Daviesbacteria bacterium RIFCSPHIGHO2_01_FULL_44_29]OGE39914.1 MAG: hypothetical protein A3D25_03840 [Candidatus Daviesbacteria bacterium RIFCSPHIGHO2_02_FULL_43_12]OGE40528.1 MAG: hypothetical protein A3E86_00950 [Candidatus Daviesbacteria bacterium RIFCSPHIGHO2_12_FULL_47_45]OGE70405.1 MAG: hypothetical protein A3B55_01730 [Candidatus Daviesbacteria bacterium RIFCSPLOWO2_01_FULL_43_15]